MAQETTLTSWFCLLPPQHAKHLCQSVFANPSIFLASSADWWAWSTEHEMGDIQDGMPIFFFFLTITLKAKEP